MEGALELLDIVSKLDTQVKDEPDVLYEYIIGQRASLAKYLQRFGAPGHYQYVYPSNGFSRMTRRAKAVFGRIIRRSRRFFKKYQESYGAKGFNVKPKTWHDSVMTVTKSDGGILNFHVNLKQHGIYSYRSHRGKGGVAVKMNKSKKKGVLRYR
jgi:hypothetical protein